MEEKQRYTVKRRMMAFMQASLLGRRRLLFIVRNQDSTPVVDLPIKNGNFELDCHELRE